MSVSKSLLLKREMKCKYVDLNLLLFLLINICDIIQDRIFYTELRFQNDLNGV